MSEPIRRQIRHKIVNLFIPMPDGSGVPNINNDILSSEDDDKENTIEKKLDKKVKNFSNTQVNPRMYNYIDLVDRPFHTQQDLDSFIKQNQKWAQNKDRIKENNFKK